LRRSVNAFFIKPTVQIAQLEGNMKKLMVIMMLICLKVTLVSAEEKLIRFNMQEKGFPPFMILNNSQSPGIMFEVLQVIASKHGYTIEPVSIPRKRVEKRLKSGKLDAMPLAKEWVSNPNDYEFTEPVLNIYNRLFSLAKTPVEVFKIEDFIGSEIIAHIGYRYPMLDPYFNDGRISRRDIKDETTMLQMIDKKRARIAIINEHVGKWIIKQKQWQGKFTISTNDVGFFAYRIAFSKKWKRFVDQFNQELSQMKNQGILEKIISKYQ